MLHLRSSLFISKPDQLKPKEKRNKKGLVRDEEIKGKSRVSGVLSFLLSRLINSSRPRKEKKRRE
jgi:hypothetical protein